MANRRQVRWETSITAPAAGEFRRLDHQVAARLVAAIKRLAAELTEHGRPMLSDVKPMKGADKTLRLAVDDWRIIYTASISETDEGPVGVLSILKVDHRSSIYKRR